MFPGAIGQSAGLSAGAISTQNLNPLTGVATLNSTVAAVLNGAWDTIGIQVFGTYTGNLSLQATLDGVNWVTLTGVTSITNTITGVQTNNIPSGQQQIYQVDISGFWGVRVTALGAMTGSAAVTILPGIGSGIVGIDTPVQLAGGANAIGGSSAVANANQSIYSVNSAATTNAAVIKGSAGSVYNAIINNTSAAAKYVRLYNKATAPVPGTDTPVVVIAVQAGTSKEIDFSVGHRFATGIGVSITGAATVLDATVVAAGDVQLDINYA